MFPALHYSLEIPDEGAQIAAILQMSTELREESSRQ